MTRYISMGPQYAGERQRKKERGKGGKSKVLSRPRTPVARKSRVTRAHSLCVDTGKHDGHKLMRLVSTVAVYSKNYPSRMERSILDAHSPGRLFENEYCMIPLAARSLGIHYILLFWEVFF